MEHESGTPAGSPPIAHARLLTGVGIAALAILIGAMALFVWPGYLQTDAYEYNGGHWEPPREAAAIELTDQNGQPFSLANHRGKVVLLYFGYTYCPDYCPTTLLETQEIERLLGDKAEDVEVVMVSVDPARDTPERLKEYMAFFNPEYYGLTGTPEQIDALKMPYGIVAQAATPDANGQYLVDHSTALFAIDQEGNLRLSWPFGMPAEDIADDIEHILD